jgi:hypothetical protein
MNTAARPHLLLTMELYFYRPDRCYRGQELPTRVVTPSNVCGFLIRRGAAFGLVFWSRVCRFFAAIFASARPIVLELRA